MCPKTKPTQRQAPRKIDSGLPLAPWILINNSVDASTVYADAVCSLIPHSSVYTGPDLMTPIHKPQEYHAITIWANSSTVPSEVVDTARTCQVRALSQGCNTASVNLCNDATFQDFQAVNADDWPVNHFTINVDGAPVEEISKKIVKWLFTVFSVRETLHLIPISEMLEIDPVVYKEYKYCSLKDASKHRKDAKLQFVALIASKPELTEPNTLTWKVVDRSGEAKFYFNYRGPACQHTWDWVLGLRPGDRKVLPRMPMVALQEPIGRKVLLSPLRATGATIRGVGHVTMGLGRGVHWFGDKISVRRSEKQKFIPEADWLKAEEEKKKRKDEKKTYASSRGSKGWMSARKEILNNEREFKIFNEKGEKTWKSVEDDTTSSVAPSLVDEKVEKEFC
ncbi:hypothetical protein GJ744_006761 [Endocarpon pusillum]|uniref:Uncharacterized protein n=1 Tax=Endocarpon pusillum TaxID=364733 RepID=A0A8H7A7U1_9EURO|nr:hypothetical protein GJ744_006761 [Endocarpon pusillum]